MCRMRCQGRERVLTGMLDSVAGDFDRDRAADDDGAIDPVHDHHRRPYGVFGSGCASGTGLVLGPRCASGTRFVLGPSCASGTGFVIGPCRSGVARLFGPRCTSCANRVRDRMPDTRNIHHPGHDHHSLLRDDHCGCDDDNPLELQ